MQHPRPSIHQLGGILDQVFHSKVSKSVSWVPSPSSGHFTICFQLWSFKEIERKMKTGTSSVKKNNMDFFPIILKNNKTKLRVQLKRRKQERNQDTFNNLNLLFNLNLIRVQWIRWITDYFKLGMIELYRQLKETTKYFILTSFEIRVH